MARRFGGRIYEQDARYGAYGSGNRAAGKRAANERAKDLREDGYNARITLERQDYGIWWQVWKRKR